MIRNAYTVSRDDSIYEAFPDLVLTEKGKLICVFLECTHHLDRSGARVMLCESYDRGRTWSPKKAFTERCEADRSFNCPRISKLNDGTLAIVCDRFDGGENKKSEIYLWRGDQEGLHWSKPQVLPFNGMVPDKLQQLKSGRLLLAAHFKNPETEKLEQYLWYSDKNGNTWSERVTVGADERYHLCEASLLECHDGTLVAFMRENSMQGYDCMKAFSFDGGQSWDGLYQAPIPGCHRPVSGFLNDGTIMITHRFLPGGKGGMGNWTQNVFASFMTEKDVLERERNQQCVRIMPLDYDRSSEADLGYTGWVQFDDHEIYVVNYLLDDAPKAFIKGYCFFPEDVLIQREGGTL